MYRFLVVLSLFSGGRFFFLFLLGDEQNVACSSLSVVELLDCWGVCSRFLLIDGFF